MTSSVSKNNRTANGVLPNPCKLDSPNKLHKVDPDGEYCRAVQTINDLCDLGIENLGIEDFENTGVPISLPKIILVGNQSSGKSSLIEAISGLKVPRGNGTCTKCPMEIRLRNTENTKWKCTVSIRRDEAPPDHANTYFQSTDNEDDVENILRGAQRAILNPSRSLDDFRNSSDLINEIFTDERPFSKGRVVVDVVGAPITLTFIDLPGLVVKNQFNSKPQAEDEFGGFAKELVDSYLKDSNCLALITISMDYDLELCMATAANWNPNGAKRIGVLMKADCMKAGEEQQWPDVLRNKTFTLEYGYYMTLGIATDERKKGIDHEAGRQSERDFFEEKKLWNNEFKERSGTDKLIDTLIEILSSMIKASIPNLKNILDRHQEETKSKLLRRSPLSGKLAQKELIKLCRDFVDEIRNEIEARPQPIRQAYRSLAHDLYKTQLKFDITQPKSESHKNEVEHKPRLGDSANPLSLDGIRKLIDAKRGIETGDQIPWGAHHFARTICLRKWEKISLHTFGEIEAQVIALIAEVSSRIFKDFPRLAKDINSAAVNLLREDAASTHHLISTYCKWEESRPFLQNEVDFKRWSDEHYLWLYQYRYVSQSKRSNSQESQNLNDQAIYRKTLQDMYGIVLSEDKILLPTAEELTKFQAEDAHSVEMAVLAGALAYFNLACRRAVDVIPMCIENHFLVAFGLRLRDHLEEKLGITGKGMSLQTCTDYTAPGGELLDEIIKLNMTCNVLAKALKIIDDI